jgi:uncharacterized damage-inducible protein DinB
MPIRDAILMELDQESQATKRVLECIPEDKLGWKPHQKSSSLGQLALHLAAAPGKVAAAAVQDRFEIPEIPQPEALSRQEILDTFSESLAAAKETIGQMDDAQLLSLWTGTKNGQAVMSVPRIGFIRAILLNHGYHHRGQLSVYLRLLDVPLPPVYGQTADENPWQQ